MELVPGFTELLQGLSATMTTPTYHSLVTAVTGWVFASKRTVTRMILAAGSAADKHYSSYHRLLSAARWSLDAVGLALFDLLAPCLGNVVMLGFDDTLARKRGLKMFGTGMHHDPLLSSRGKAITNWGHSWVMLGVIVELPFRRGHYYFLPLLFRLYLNKKSSARHRRVYRTRPELAVEMLMILSNHCRIRNVHAVADSAYGGKSVPRSLARELRPHESFAVGCAALRCAAWLLPWPARATSQTGRSVALARRKSDGLLPATLSRYLWTNRRSPRGRLPTAGRRSAMKRFGVVAVDPLTGGRPRQAFYSTCADASAEEVITRYAMLWSVEVTFHDSKQHLGFEQPQGWSRRAVERTAPLAMLLYSLVVLWFAREGHRSWRPLDCPWYTSKTEPSFADMLATLRRLSVRRHVLSLALQGPGTRKIKQLLEYAIATAA